MIELLQKQLPIDLKSAKITPQCGVILVDIINGFCRVGDGPLAPSAPNAQVDQMICEADDWSRRFVQRNQPVLALIDCHDDQRPEPPYPPHCLRDSGHERLVEPLQWLYNHEKVTCIEKDCINGYIGAITTEGNLLEQWVKNNQLKQLLVMGICTDICVMDLVLTLLSARNHQLLGDLQDIIVWEPGCATYDLSATQVEQLGLPSTAVHPQALCHHLGLTMMASRGAILADHYQW